MGNLVQSYIIFFLNRAECMGLFLALCESANLDEFLLQLATASHHSLILLQHAARPAILEAGHTEILRGLGILVNCLVYLAHLKKCVD